MISFEKILFVLFSKQILFQIIKSNCMLKYIVISNLRKVYSYLDILNIIINIIRV